MCYIDQESNVTTSIEYSTNTHQLNRCMRGQVNTLLNPLLKGIMHVFLRMEPLDQERPTQ